MKVSLTARCMPACRIALFENIIKRAKDNGKGFTDLEITFAGYGDCCYCQWLITRRKERDTIFSVNIPGMLGC